jgi:hypothetical protein
MTEYVLQVKNDTKQLIKSYTVTEDHPIRDINTVHDLNRKQIVITDENLYNEIISVYEQNKLNAKFTVDEQTNDISWIIE